MGDEDPLPNGRNVGIGSSPGAVDTAGDILELRLVDRLGVPAEGQVGGGQVFADRSRLVAGPVKNVTEAAATAELGFPRNCPPRFARPGQAARWLHPLRRATLADTSLSLIDFTQ